MQWINNNSIWWDEHKIFVVLLPYSGFRANREQYRCLLWSHLAVALDHEIPYRLNVVKNRSAFLDPYKPMLNKVFEEYVIMNADSGPGWRGSIQLSESDWLKLQLMQ